MQGFFTVLSILLLGVHRAKGSSSGATCEFDNTSCVDPAARGSTTFNFAPIFPEGATFVYAFDTKSLEEAQNETIAPGNIAEPSSKVSFWIEYTETNLNSAAHYETDMVFLVNENITGTPSGGSNGCDGVWGETCSEQVKELIAREIGDGGSGVSLGGVLNYLNVTSPVTNLSCPWGVLDQSYPVSLDSGLRGGMLRDTDGMIAEENGEDTHIFASGNRTYSWHTQVFDDVSETQQLARVAVAVIARRPLIGDLSRDFSENHVDLVCAKATPISAGNEGSTTSSTHPVSQPTGSGDSAASLIRPSNFLTGATVSMILAALAWAD